MELLLKISKLIDRMTERIGRLLFWLVLAMILVGAFNAVARSLSRFVGINLSSNAFIEMQWYMFSLVFLFGGAYALKHGAHVRVDVLYGNVSDRARAWINFVGTLVFLIPFCCFMLAVTVPSVANSWSVWEQSPDPGGLPRYPIKSAVPIAFLLLLIQAVSEGIKHLAALRGVEATPIEEPPAGSEMV